MTCSDPTPVAHDGIAAALGSAAALVADALPDVAMLGCDRDGRVTVAIGPAVALVAGQRVADNPRPGDGDAPRPIERLCCALGLDGLGAVMTRTPPRGAWRSELTDADGRVLDVTVRSVDDDVDPTRVIAVLRDVSDVRRTARELHEAAERFTMAFDNAHIGMALIDAKGTWLRVNLALCELTGYAREALLQRTVRDMTHPEDVESDLEPLIRMLGGELRSYEHEKRFVTAAGETIWVLWCVALIRDDAGEPLYIVAQVEDITERKRLEAELASIASHDVLTGLWNRRHLEQELGRQIARHERYGEETSVLLIDLDRFKPINDSHGHAAGDQALRHVAHLLEQRVRGADVVARLGGDEFVILAPQTGREAAEAFRQSLEEVLARTPFTVACEQFPVRASIGIGVIDDDIQTPADVLRMADVDMYEAKARHHAAAVAAHVNGRAPADG